MFPVEFSAGVSTNDSATGSLASNAASETVGSAVASEVEGVLAGCSMGSSGLASAEVSTGTSAEGCGSAGASLDSVTGSSAEGFWAGNASATSVVGFFSLGSSIGFSGAAGSSGIDSVGFLVISSVEIASLFSSLDLAGVLAAGLASWIFEWTLVLGTTLFVAWVGLDALGGLLKSAFSCVLLAELAVGRIMRARNPSSTGLELALLAREPGRSLDDWLCGDPRGVLRMLEAVGVEERTLAPFFKVDGLRDAVEVLADVAVPFDLAAWVDAVAAAGTRAGLVGDLVAGLMVVFETREAAVVLAVSRAGVVEGRPGREGALVAVFTDVRLGLEATVLVGSLEVAGLVAR